MREPLFTIVCLALIAGSQIAAIFVAKPRWIQVLLAVGIVLASIGSVRTSYYHDLTAKHLFSIPGLIIAGIAITLHVVRFARQSKAEHQFKGRS